MAKTRAATECEQPSGADEGEETVSQEPHRRAQVVGFDEDIRETEHGPGRKAGSELCHGFVENPEQEPEDREPEECGTDAQSFTNHPTNGVGH
jgi:hypothetical protein